MSIGNRLPVPMSTAAMSAACNFRELPKAQQTALADIMSHGFVYKPQPGQRFTQQLAHLMYEWCSLAVSQERLVDDAETVRSGLSAIENGDWFIPTMNLADDCVILDDDAAAAYLAANDEAQRIMRLIRLLVEAYTVEAARLQADTVAQVSAETLQLLKVAGVETSHTELARNHAAIKSRRRRRNICNLATRQAALVGCAASTAPPAQVKTMNQLNRNKIE